LQLVSKLHRTQRIKAGFHERTIYVYLETCRSTNDLQNLSFGE